MDLGLLLLRVTIGALFAGHGAQKLFGWFRGPGLEGTEAMVDSLGYRPARPYAVVLGAAEATAGVLFLLGLFTPLAAVAAIGVMTNAIGSVHAPHGVWNAEGGYEFPLLMLVGAATLVFTGPGALALDPSIQGTIWGFAALAVGLLAGIAVLSTREPEALAEDAEAVEEERRAA